MPAELEPWGRIEAERSDQRTNYQRDRDRVLYSREFRRLSGVTQVARADESYFYHDRLSHTLKVSQVGGALTDILLDRATEQGVDLGHLQQKVNEGDLKHSISAMVETASLAHDLGHPPFGHAIEKRLDEMVDEMEKEITGASNKEFGGFEGNAQSFRIVTKVAKPKKKYKGLNLTFGSLQAILKYPWGVEDDRRAEKNKWGFYPTENDEINELRNASEDFGDICLEAAIMDYADDVTYAVHDVDDFYRVGLVPLDQLLIDTEERSRFIKYVCEKEEVTAEYVNDFFDWLRENPAEDALETPFKNTDREIASINKFSSFLIKRYLTVNEPDELYIENNSRLELNIDEDLLKEIKILKRLTFYYVVENSNLRAQQYGQKRIIEKLFSELEEQSKSDAYYHNIIPHPFRGRLENTNSEMERIRTIVDLICSMTEQQAIDIYGRITGTNPGSLREGILR